MERLILLHLVLSEICTGRSTLDENASDEELLDPILYYYVSPPSVLPSSKSPSSSSSSLSPNTAAQAIQFAGLCLALYRLPQSIHPLTSRPNQTKKPSQVDPINTHENGNENSASSRTTFVHDEDTTRVVHLKHSILVFVPLWEDSQSLGNIGGHPNNNQSQSNAHGTKEKEADNPKNTNATNYSSSHTPAATPSFPLILAVVQIGKPSMSTLTTTTLPQSSAGVCGIAAVRLAVERAHATFCLWRGGGIHWRLQQQQTPHPKLSLSTPPTTKPGAQEEREVSPVVAIQACLYPGMDELFQLRKQLRNRSDSTATTTATNNEWNAIQSQKIAICLQHLPITALRRDLAIHYDEFCVNNSRTWLNSRSLFVEQIPPPIPIPSGQHRLYSAPVTVSAHAKELILSTMDRLVLDRGDWRSQIYEQNGGNKSVYRDAVDEGVDTGAAPSEQQLPQILGIAAFVRGQPFSTTRTCQTPSFLITEERTTTLRLGFSMAQMQWQMLQYHSHNHQRDTLVQPSSPSKKISSLRPFALSFAKDDVTDPLQQTTASSPSPWQNAPRQGSFLTPPPLSFLSALDDSNSFEDGRGGQIWAPPVSLPVVVDSDATTPSIKVRTRWDVRICWYNRDDFAFLLILSRTQPEQNVCAYKDIFVDAERLLSAAVNAVVQKNPSGTKDMSRDVQHVTTKIWQVHGQDVIAIDRESHSMILFSYPRQPFETQIEASVTESDFSNSDAGQEWSDCRHRLASQLSPVCMRAIDDAMEEIRQRRIFQGGSAVNEPFEMCTLLSNNRWMCAFAIDKQELYALFDSTSFVTVADVQHAMMQIRSELLDVRPTGNSIR